MVDSLYIVIPAYNEEENILECVNYWYPIIEKYNTNGESRLVIVNDGSMDRTKDVLYELLESRPYLTVLTKENGGHGSAVLFGYKYAIEKGVKFVFQTDSDGQTNPDEFHSFWKRRNKYDAIIGVRLKRGDGKKRKFIEDTVCFLLRLIFGVRVRDANAPFRLMRTDLLKRYIDRLHDDYNIPNIMFTVFFMFYRERVKFLPISFKPRQGGTNSINVKKIIVIGIKAVGSFFGFRREMKRTPHRRTNNTVERS